MISFHRNFSVDQNFRLQLSDQLQNPVFICFSFCVAFLFASHKRKHLFLWTIVRWCDLCTISRCSGRYKQEGSMVMCTEMKKVRMSACSDAFGLWSSRPGFDLHTLHKLLKPYVIESVSSFFYCRMELNKLNFAGDNASGKRKTIFITEQGEIVSGLAEPVLNDHSTEAFLLAWWRFSCTGLAVSEKNFTGRAPSFDSHCIAKSLCIRQIDLICLLSDHCSLLAWWRISCNWSSSFRKLHRPSSELWSTLHSSNRHDLPAIWSLDQ